MSLDFERVGVVIIYLRIDARWHSRMGSEINVLME